MTQKSLIKKYLESLYPDWIREFEVHRINTEFGFIGPRGERDIREMLADGEIEGKLEGKYRWVRAVRVMLTSKPKVNIPIIGEVNEERVKFYGQESLL